MFFPALREPRGLPRLRALFDRWVRRVSVEIDSGCIYISGAVEFDDRPGPVRDALVDMVRTWQPALERAIAHRDRRRPPARRHRCRADAVRGARPDPCAAPRRPLPAPPGAADAGPRRVRAHRRMARARARRRLPLSARPACATRARCNPVSHQEFPMPRYTPPLRDMQFVLHELLERPRRTEGAAARTPTSTPTRSTRCSKKAASSPPKCIAPLNPSGDVEGCTLDVATHEVQHAEGLQGGLRAVRRRRLAGAERRPGSTAARACRTS